MLKPGYEPGTNGGSFYHFCVKNKDLSHFTLTNHVKAGFKIKNLSPCSLISFSQAYNGCMTAYLTFFGLFSFFLEGEYEPKNIDLFYKNLAHFFSKLIKLWLCRPDF
jgi:hypothetical protein